MDDKMLAAATARCDKEPLTNVSICRDDIFASSLSEPSFDRVHLRIQLAPLGKAMQQVTTARRLAKPNGWIVLEEPDAASWCENSLAPLAAHLRSLIAEVFARSGGDFNAGQRLPEYLRAVGVDPATHPASIAPEPGHPYLQSPVQFATSLRPQLLELVDEDELNRLVSAAKSELAEANRWGMTTTLVQAWGRAT